MFWNRVLEMASSLEANEKCVGRMFDLTIRYLSGKEVDCMFLAGMERALEESKGDENAITMLDEWLTGLCLHQLGLFSVWGRKGRWSEAAICWSDVAAKLARMTGGDLPSVRQEEMLAEWKLLGCGFHKRSMHAILTLAVGYPVLKKLRSLILREAHWVTIMRYPLFGVAQQSIEVTFGLFTLLAFIGSIILLHRMMITYPILSLTSEVSRESLRTAKLISYEGAALIQDGARIFGPRILCWISVGLWLMALEWLPKWWIRRLLRD